MVEYRVYELTNLLGRRYFGLSEDVSRRLAQHNAGESKWTSKHRPWEVTWQSVPLSLSEARKLESAFKRQKGGMGVATLKSTYGISGS